MKIFKYKLSQKGHNVISMPMHRRYLHVAMYDNSLQLWARVNEMTEMEDVDIYVLPTGENWTGLAPQNITHIGTVVDIGEGLRGDLVWHVFYRDNDYDYEQEKKCYVMRMSKS